MFKFAAILMFITISAGFTCLDVVNYYLPDGSPFGALTGIALSLLIILVVILFVTDEKIVTVEHKKIRDKDEVEFTDKMYED